VTPASSTARNRPLSQRAPSFLQCVSRGPRRVASGRVDRIEWRRSTGDIPIPSRYAMSARTRSHEVLIARQILLGSFGLSTSRPSALDGEVNSSVHAAQRFTAAPSAEQLGTSRCLRATAALLLALSPAGVAQSLGTQCDISASTLYYS